MKLSDVKMTLQILMIKDYKGEITLKTKQHLPFIAKVKDFNFDEDNTKVILKRCEETIFPNQIDDDIQDIYTMYVKDIKNVERHG